jgi:adenosine/AMP kinase
MDIKSVEIDKPDDMNFILGHSHFIKTVEDLYEAVVQSVPGVKYGIAFCEASQDRLVRWTGNDDKLINLAQKNAMNIGAGHSFIIFMEGAFPLNMLNAIKMVPEVCRIFCATANPVQVLVAETELGRGIIGVVDGLKPAGIETEKDITWRRVFLGNIGYKQ